MFTRRPPRILGWLAAACFGVILLVGTSSQNDTLRTHLALSESGEPTAATVVQRHSAPARGGRYYSLEYAYVVGSGSFTGKTQYLLDERTYETSPEGSSLPILYLPSNPGISCYAPEALTNVQPQSPLLGLCVLFLGVLGLIAETACALYNIRNRGRGCGNGKALL